MFHRSRATIGGMAAQFLRRTLVALRHMRDNTLVDDAALADGTLLPFREEPRDLRK